MPWATKKRYDDFDYGYALTVHKAQGSQWDHVMLFDESWASRIRASAGSTRPSPAAAERLTIVK